MDSPDSNSPGAEQKPFPEIPEAMTHACKAFLDDLWQLLDFVTFVPTLADRADEVARKAAETLLKVSREYRDVVETAPEEEEQYEETLKKGAGATERLKENMKLFNQMFLCRSVDNFLTYISELLTLIFRTRPETLRSRAQVRLDYILKFENMTDLISALVERRVNELSYQGMEQLTDDLRESIGLQLFTDDLLRSKAIRLIEIRNVIVHNRSIINLNFVRKIPDAAADLGKPLTLRGTEVLDDLTDLAIVVFNIDRRSIEKFALETVGRDLLEQKAQN